MARKDSLRHSLDLLGNIEKHWIKVNQALEPGQLRLSGAFTIVDFAVLADEFRASFKEVEVRSRARADQSSELSSEKRRLKHRFRQLRLALESLLPETGLAGQMPLTPQISDGSGKWRRAIDEARQVWTKANLIQPITLAGGYSLKQFVEETSQLSSAYTSLASHRGTERGERSDRQRLWRQIFDRAKQYRQAVQAQLDLDDPLVKSLPKLSETPTPVRG